MKAEFKLWESDSHSYGESCVIENGNLHEIRSDIQRVLELHQFRAEKYRRDYIERWGQEQYDKAYPAAQPAQKQGEDRG